MKRVDQLAVVTRRGFCGGIAGCFGLALVGCTDGDGRLLVQTGPLTGGDGSPVDAPHSPHDAGTDGSGLHDASNAMCPQTGATDVGDPTTFVANTPVYFSSGNFFVVRDSGGLYALTAVCTHSGYTVTAEPTQFHCKLHDATFDFDGNVTHGPAFLPLVHYAMCTLANGHVGVIKSQLVSQGQRLAA